jgi:Programmed cell death protein 2, C-terminal putative domain
MWNNDEGDELNEDGRPVQLYLPIETQQQRALETSSKTTVTSHIGGRPSLLDKNQVPTCDNCNDSLWLLVQMKISSSPSSDDHRHEDYETYYRHISVFCCPKEDCFATVKFDNGFACGGQGVFKCIQQRRVEVEDNDLLKSATVGPVAVVGNKASVSSVVAPAKPCWYDDSDNKKIGDTNDDWGLDNTVDVSKQEQSLEDAVVAMEKGLEEDGSMLVMTKKKATTKHEKKPSAASNNDDHSDVINEEQSFKYFRLKVQDEPMATRPALEDDDVGLLESDEKIRNMLARYMAEEDDEDILAALEGNGGGDGGGRVVAEEDERLTDEERVLRSFQDRLRRAPRQVVRRAAPGGIPLWSVPDKNRKSGKKLWTVPDCCGSCGHKLGFEFQLLPSVLSTLEVDRYAAATNSSANPSRTPYGSNGRLDLDELLSNGLNFGSVAVFSCANDECPAKQSSSSSSLSHDGQDVFLVIQESVDEAMSLHEKKNNKSKDEKTHQQQHHLKEDYHKLPFRQELPQATMAILEDLDDDDEFELDG